MDIVIISEFCEDLSKTDNDRFLYLAKKLSDKNDVELVTSSFRHTTKSHRRAPGSPWPFKITFIEEPGYPKNVCLRRFRSHRIWGENVAGYIMGRKAPDVIYCAVPSLTGPSRVAQYCEEEHIRFVIDVQDLWPEAFRMVVRMPAAGKLAFTPFKGLADGIYGRADAICAVSDTYGRRALSVSRKCREAATVFLGTELSVFDAYAGGKPALEKEAGAVWLAYCGTLGSSYDITVVMDALAELDDARIRFIVMGDGPKKEQFQRYADAKKVDAVFLGRLPYDQMCSLLSACDIAVNPIEHMAAQSIINKHADYAAAGIPVISTQESEEYRRLVEGYRMGFNCRNHDAGDLAEKIKILADDAALRAEMGRNARRCAEERFDRAATYGRLEGQILAGPERRAPCQGDRGTLG